MSPPVAPTEAAALLRQWMESGQLPALWHGDVRDVAELLDGGDAVEATRDAVEATRDAVEATRDAVAAVTAGWAATPTGERLRYWLLEVVLGAEQRRGAEQDAAELALAHRAAASFAPMAARFPRASGTHSLSLAGPYPVIEWGTECPGVRPFVAGQGVETVPPEDPVQWGAWVATAGREGLLRLAEHPGLPWPLVRLLLLASGGQDPALEAQLLVLVPREMRELETRTLEIALLTCWHPEVIRRALQHPEAPAAWREGRTETLLEEWQRHLAGSPDWLDSLAGIDLTRDLLAGGDPVAVAAVARAWPLNPGVQQELGERMPPGVARHWAGVPALWGAADPVTVHRLVARGALGSGAATAVLAAGPEPALSGPRLGAEGVRPSLAPAFAELPRWARLDRPDGRRT